MEPSYVLEAGIVICSLVATGSIPWAFLVERRLARIEANLNIATLGRLERLELRIEKLEAKNET